MKNRVLHSGIKKTPYEAVFGSALRVTLSTIPTPREVFDAVEDEQYFENALTALAACPQSKDDAVIAKEASLNETVEVVFERYEDTPPYNTVKLCVVCLKSSEDSLFCCK
ncbi:uncharacterized protein NPIL_695101 [Nephila pilipes]|uniref:Uncharacterized protein n=1 Tax=Nephila pilipes TaxID=299642 RepID=A0A8X6NI14_NEPPI|nr:uncharacterized protein NPIL_695101 [Nephila pilipes]